MSAADTIRDALEASRHIAECGEHPDHLLDAENKARAAAFALDELEAELARTKTLADTAASFLKTAEAELERLTVGRATLEDQTNRAELAEARVAALEAALRGLMDVLVIDEDGDLQGIPMETWASAWCDALVALGERAVLSGGSK